MIELQVPYSEKNLAKNLGAKWNPKLKIWFITKDMDISLFVRWIPKILQHNLEINHLKQNKESINNVQNNIIIPPCGSIEQPYCLKNIVDEIKNFIIKKYSNLIWVIVEISELKAYHKNLFLSLVEYDQQGNLLARVRGIIWDYQNTIKEFIITTNIELKPGIKVLAQLSIDYHLQYGLTFVINNLDPSYSLGDANAKLLKIKQQLINEKIFDLNKNLALPFDFYHIAVISPAGAAGLGDFKQEADQLAANNLCKFDYYTAIFQSIETSISIKSALTSIVASETNYNAIVIIRGGGATSDLTWLNDYAIAKAICLTKIPVFCGIGHNKDQTIIDQIATVSLDTPSKVINYIINHIVNKSTKIANEFEFIKQYFYKKYEKLNNELLNNFEYIKNHAIQKIEYVNKILDKELSSIPELSKEKLLSLQQILEITMHQILSRSPEQILSMGFVLAYTTNNIDDTNQRAEQFDLTKDSDKKKHLIRSKNIAMQHQEILLQFHDGELKTIINKDKYHE